MNATPKSTLRNVTDVARFQYPSCAVLIKQSLQFLCHLTNGKFSRIIADYADKEKIKLLYDYNANWTISISSSVPFLFYFTIWFYNYMNYIYILTDW
jgi:hypothetical protein